MQAEKVQLSLTELQFYERILIDFNKNGKEREKALFELENYCRWKDNQVGLSCANLAILYKSLGDLPRAYSSSVMAYKKNPSNPYYRNLMRQLAMATGNLSDMEKRLGKDGRIFSLYSYAIYYCQAKSLSRALDYILLLIQEKQIRREQLERGIFSECLKENPILINELLSQVEPNPHSYKEILEEEEQNSHPFSEIWDFSYAKNITEGGFEEKKLTTNKEFTKLWFQFKKSILTKNYPEAERTYQEMMKFVSGYKKKGSKEKILAESLELAIELILNQNPEFKSFRPLR